MSVISSKNPFVPASYRAPIDPGRGKPDASKPEARYTIIDPEVAARKKKQRPGGTNGKNGKKPRRRKPREDDRTPYEYLEVFNEINESGVLPTKFSVSRAI